MRLTPPVHPMPAKMPMPCVHFLCTSEGYKAHVLLAVHSAQMHNKFWQVRHPVPVAGSVLPLGGQGELGGLQHL